MFTIYSALAILRLAKVQKHNFKKQKIKFFIPIPETFTAALVSISFSQKVTKSISKS